MKCGHVAMVEMYKSYIHGRLSGFYRRRDAPVFHEMLDRHERERQEAIAADKTGNGYIYDMFSHELANHEYGYAHDAEDALEALGLTMEEIEKSPIMLRAFGRAKKAQFADPF